MTNPSTKFRQNPFIIFGVIHPIDTPTDMQTDRRKHCQTVSLFGSGCDMLVKLARETGHSWYSVFTGWAALAGWSRRPGWSSDGQFHRCLYDTVVVAGSAAAVDFQLTEAVVATSTAVLARTITFSTQTIAATALRLLPGLTCRLSGGRQEKNGYYVYCTDTTDDAHDRSVLVTRTPDDWAIVSSLQPIAEICRKKYTRQLLHQSFK